MLFKCMGFGGALGLAPPVLDAVVGEAIGCCALDFAILMSFCIGSVRACTRP